MNDEPMDYCPLAGEHACRRVAPYYFADGTASHCATCPRWEGTVTGRVSNLELPYSGMAKKLERQTRIHFAPEPTTFLYYWDNWRQFAADVLGLIALVAGSLALYFLMVVYFK
jgi:hypothetical protein